MQRVKKRLWTAAVVTGATLLILAAVLVGAVRILDLAAPGYRQKLADVVSALADRRVTIEHMDLSWQGLRPRLELSGVVVHTEDGQAQIFSVSELAIPFSWMSLVERRALPTEVRARGLMLGLEWRPDGSIGIRDLSRERAASAPLNLADAAVFVSRLERIVIEDSTVEWLEPGGARTRRQLTEINVQLQAHPQAYSLQLRTQLPPDWGRSLEVRAEAHGDIAHLEKLRTRGTVVLTGLLPQYWLAPYLRPDLELRGGAVEVQLNAKAEGLALKEAQIKLTAADAE
ncbi:MAG: hypothetical protein L0099_13550, partial [Acidobacteria bacterium]|nr:hypothetical protein [Acidobacteriota bacterium]